VVRAGSFVGLFGRALLAASLVVACGGSDLQTLCSAFKVIGGNNADAQTLRNSSDAAAITAAADRLTQQTQSTVSSLRAIKDGQLVDIAGRLAAVDEKLLPILDQFRAGTSESAISAARKAYTTWGFAYNAVVDDVPSGISCT